MGESGAEHTLIAARSLLGGPEPAALLMNHELVDGLAHKAGFLLGREVDVVCLDSQQARMFSVQGFPSPLVVYTPRHIELTTACRFALLTDLDPEVRQTFGRTYFSEMLSSGLIRRGLHDSALRVFLGSWFGRLEPSASGQMPFLVAPRWTLKSILEDPDPISLIATIGFGITHEVGHFVKLDAESRSKFTPVVQQQLRTRLAATCEDRDRQLRLSEQQQDRLLANCENIAGSPLNPEHVLDEVASDFFAWDCLFNYTYDVCQRDGHTFDPGKIVSEIMVQMACLYFFERAEVNSRLYAGSGLSPHDYATGAFQDIGLQARASLLRSLFAETMANAHFSTADGTARRVHDAYKGAMLEMSDYLKPRARDFEVGIRHALDAADRGEDMDETLTWGVRLAAATLEEGEGYFKELADKFCHMAGSADTPGIQRLREALGKSRSARHPT